MKNQPFEWLISTRGKVESLMEPAIRLCLEHKLAEGFELVGKMEIGPIVAHANYLECMSKAMLRAKE